MQKSLLLCVPGILGIVFAVAYAQIDTSPLNLANPTTLVNIATNQRCDTYDISTILTNICDVTAQQGPNSTISVGTASYSLSICDSHCRCTHGGQYGLCVARSTINQGQNAPLVDSTGKMCKCYYSAPPPGMPTNNNILDSAEVSPLSLFGTSYCIGWYLTPFALKVPKYCSLVSNNATNGNCNTDCYCSHGYDYGSCDPAGPCQCYYNGGSQVNANGL